MKKCELVLGNVVKAYKGEEEFVITNITEEVITLNGEKEVKVKTLLKNYKMVEKEKEIIYGIKVSKGINQTLIWKVLKKVCELKNEEGTKIANELKEKYPEAFQGAVRCLVSKKRINYINSIC